MLLIALASIMACGGEQATQQQSPVDIAGYTIGDIPTLSFAYNGHAEHLTNTGEFVKVNYDQGSRIRLGEHTYRLTEAHTHNPSEHTLNGESLALEMHLVHKRESGGIAVVGLLYRLANRTRLYKR